MRSSTIVPEGISWNYTTYLNIVFLAVFAVLYWLYRSRRSVGGGATAGPACEMHGTVPHAHEHADAVGG
jgi:hypothetical protein